MEDSQDGVARFLEASGGGSEMDGWGSPDHSSADEAPPLPEVPSPTSSSTTPTSARRRISSLRQPLIRVAKVLTKHSHAKVGRAAVSRILGKQGTDMINALRTSASKFSDQKTSQALGDHIVRLVFKLLLLAEQQKISPSYIATADSIVIPLIRQTVNAFFNSSSDERVLSSAMCLAHSQLVEAADGAILSSGKLKRLSTLVEFYSTPKYLHSVMMRPEFAEEKAIILDALQHVLSLADGAFLETEVESGLACNELLCHAPRIWNLPEFGCSRYCLHHHTKRLDHLINTPDLPSFLHDVDHRRVLVAFLEDRAQPEAKQTLPFLHAIKPYLVRKRPTERVSRTARLSRFFTNSPLSSPPSTSDGSDDGMSRRDTFLSFLRNSPSRARSATVAIMQSKTPPKLEKPAPIQHEYGCNTPDLHATAELLFQNHVVEGCPEPVLMDACIRQHITSQQLSPCVGLRRAYGEVIQQLSLLFHSEFLVSSYFRDYIQSLQLPRPPAASSKIAARFGFAVGGSPPTD